MYHHSALDIASGNSQYSDNGCIQFGQVDLRKCAYMLQQKYNRSHSLVSFPLSHTGNLSDMPTAQPYAPLSRPAQDYAPDNSDMQGYSQEIPATQQGTRSQSTRIPQKSK
jgi:hypothetical protein